MSLTTADPRRPSFVGMSEAEYLARFDLLNSAERNRIFNTQMEHTP